MAGKKIRCSGKTLRGQRCKNEKNFDSDVRPPHWYCSHHQVQEPKAAPKKTTTRRPTKSKSRSKVDPDPYDSSSSASSLPSRSSDSSDSPDASDTADPFDSLVSPDSSDDSSEWDSDSSDDDQNEQMKKYQALGRHADAVCRLLPRRAKWIVEIFQQLAIDDAADAAKARQKKQEKQKDQKDKEKTRREKQRGKQREKQKGKQEKQKDNQKGKHEEKEQEKRVPKHRGTVHKNKRQLGLTASAIQEAVNSAALERKTAREASGKGERRSKRKT